MYARPQDHEYAWKYDSSKEKTQSITEDPKDNTEQYTTQGEFKINSFVYYLWLLQYLCLLFLNDLWALGRGGVIYMSHLGLRISASSLLHFDQFLVLHVNHYYKMNLLWIGLRDVLIYMYYGSL